jgi:hypothetical protein
VKSVQPKVLVVFSILVSVVVSLYPTSAFALQSEQIQVAATSKCTKYKFIGMRGSGQEFDNPKEKTAENRQMGPEMASLYGYLRNFEEFKGNISFSGVPEYPAVGLPRNILVDWSDYFYSLEYVATMRLIEFYASEFRSCPDTKFIIAGYSQGAYGAHYLVKTIENSKSYLRNSIIGAIFLANPSENQEEKKGIIFRPNIVRLLKGINYRGVLNLQIDPINQQFFKTLSYYKPKDAVADFQITSWKVGQKIHSAYCSPAGEFAPAEKSKRNGCDAAQNKDFLASSAIYIREQLTELKRLDTQRRQRVLEWYGKDWQVPTNCQQIMNKSFSKLQIDMADEFKGSDVFRLRILAINLKEPSIWFVDEKNLEHISYSPEDGFYSLEASEKMERYFWALERFENVFKDASKEGIISNLIFEAEDNWRCNIDTSASD